MKDWIVAESGKIAGKHFAVQRQKDGLFTGKIYDPRVVVRYTMELKRNMPVLHGYRMKMTSVKSFRR